MPGFKHDPLADVNLIADNLRDRYKDRFSILKELLQNADDARAEEIRFGLLPSMSSSTHPLLRGPGLVIVNSGTFKDSDYSAILQFGLNEKAAEAATIGKFGLGMKSVFHFAEAFLFMAEGNGSLYRELVNPWGDSFHPDWGILDSQWDQLREDALSAVGWTSTSSPFILYLPLRQEAQLRLPDGQVTGAIVEECVGDTGVVANLLADVATGNRLASVLPLLRSLRVIQVYVPEPDGTSRRKRHAIELASGGTRPLREHQNGESALSCEIQIVHNNTEVRRLRYVGRQRYEMTEALGQIRDSRAWPSSWVRDAYGKPDQVPDKSQPHAAAVFGQDGEFGWLTIRWAVFLPIEEHEERIRLETGTPGFSLALHGHFFVDAGRNGLYGLDADTSDDLNDTRDESWVRRQWNWELAGRATLDL